jgi:hypothetical protein
MKWAKFTGDSALSRLTTEDINKSFKVFERPRGLSNDDEMTLSLAAKSRGVKNPQQETFGKWATYCLEKNMSEKAQRDYELFCGGWLQYYDMEIRREETDHIMHLEWKDKGKEVTIWISPAAKNGSVPYLRYLTVSTDPPSPPPPPPPPKSA